LGITCSVLGLGYIGLPTAILLASNGVEVRGFDVSPSVIDALNSGRSPISEPGIDERLSEVFQSNAFTVDVVLKQSDVYIICVPTPVSGQGFPDLSYVENASRKIANVAASSSLIILESTVPVGTTESVREWIYDENPKLENMCFAHCPERVIPGAIFHEIENNDRIVGGIDSRSTSAAASFYETFAKDRIIECDSMTAELCKLVENSYRDVNIALANEISIICDELRINPLRVIEIANKHPRVNILQPGCGVGGHCIAVDPRFLINQFPSLTPLIRAGRQVNDDKADWCTHKILELIERHFPSVVVFLGATYKPNTADLRESPAITILNQVAQRVSVRLVCIEPVIDHQELRVALDEKIEIVNEEFHFDIDSTLMVGLVGHDVFKNPEIFEKFCNCKIRFDPANIGFDA